VATLGLPVDLTEEWGLYVKILCENLISLNEESKDSLYWSKNPRGGNYFVKLGYKSWLDNRNASLVKWRWKTMWKFKGPLR
jgi:hypothetical protein